MIRRLRTPLVWGPISIVLLAFVVWRSRLWESGDTLGQTDPAPLLAALVLVLALPVLWAFRSARLLAAAGQPVPVRALVPMTAFANTVNNLTPGSLGEFARLYLLQVTHGVDYTTGGAVILIERFVSLGYLTVSAAIAWLTVQRQLPSWVALVLLVALAAAPAIIYRVGLRPVAWFVAHPIRRFSRGRFGGLVKGLLEAETVIARLVTRPADLAVFALSTLAVFAISTTQLVLVARAMGVDLDPLAAWGALGLSISVGVLSLLPFGLGAADLTLVALLVALGIDARPATAITFGYRLVATLPLALAGVASYAWLSARLPKDGIGGAARAARVGLAAVSPESGDGAP
jgi:uncharacterized protein (TIRG00374 family)